MGREAVCRAIWNGSESRGKALLETGHVLFRGDFRVKLAFAELKRVEAVDGWLTLDSSEGTLALKLGADAAKWVQKILHPPSRAAKLGIRPGMKISTAGIEEPDIPSTGGPELTGCDLVLIRVDEKGGLSSLAGHRDRMTLEGALWVVYPKGRKEITEMEVIEAGRAAGLKDVKVASFSATHTALKFVWPVAARGRR